MRFQRGIEDGDGKKVEPDFIRAKSLFKSAEEAILAAQKIPFEQTTLKSIFRELYEGLRQFCEALGYQYGFKFLKHDIITHFIEEKLKEERVANRFDRYRKIRNGINYYGDDIKSETVKEALEEIPKLIEILKQKIISR